MKKAYDIAGIFSEMLIFRGIGSKGLGGLKWFSFEVLFCVRINDTNAPILLVAKA